MAAPALAVPLPVPKASPKLAASAPAPPIVLREHVSFAPFPHGLLDDRRLVAHLTPEAFEAIAELDAFGDQKVELIDGQIVLVDRSAQGEDPMDTAEDHVISVESCTDLRASIDSDAASSRTQQPLVCGANVPVPDFAVVRGGRRTFTKARRPTGRDALCVVEVADSSLRHDLGRKLALYARAAVPQYVVLDLAGRRALVHENPDPAAGTYPPPAVLAETDTLRLRIGDAGETLDVPARDLLP